MGGYLHPFPGSFSPADHCKPFALPDRVPQECGDARRSLARANGNVGETPPGLPEERLEVKSSL